MTNEWIAGLGCKAFCTATAMSYASHRPKCLAGLLPGGRNAIHRRFSLFISTPERKNTKSALMTRPKRLRIEVDREGPNADNRDHSTPTPRMDPDADRPRNQVAMANSRGIADLGFRALHVRYLAHDCPLDLAPDEAHYWQWSRHLDASYYSKGPLTAYLIRGSCELFGESVFAVRLPAVVCGTFLLIGLYVLTARCFGNERLALLVAGITVTMPALAMCRTLMTIDAPFTCLWTWALVVGHHAFFRRSPWAWPALGIVIGLGILAKYTMALWIPSAMLFLVISPEHRPLLRRPGIWIAWILAGLCCLPILWWNFHNDWVTFRHVGSQTGMSIEAKSMIRWLGPIQLIAEQCALLLGVGFALWVGAAIAPLAVPRD